MDPVLNGIQLAELADLKDALNDIEPNYFNVYSKFQIAALMMQDDSDTFESLVSEEAVSKALIDYSIVTVVRLEGYLTKGRGYDELLGNLAFVRDTLTCLFAKRLEILDPIQYQAYGAHAYFNTYTGHMKHLGINPTHASYFCTYLKRTDIVYDVNDGGLKDCQAHDWTSMFPDIKFPLDA